MSGDRNEKKLSKITSVKKSSGQLNESKEGRPKPPNTNTNMPTQRYKEVVNKRDSDSSKK